MSTVLAEEHIVQGWVLVVYGIPLEQGNIRNRLRWVCRKHGLWSIDRGGSVYLGPRMEGLDTDLQRLVEQIRRDAGITEQLVHLIAGDYSAEQALYMRNMVTRTLHEDIDLIEAHIGELEQALAGVVVIKDKEGKPRNLVTTGRGRLIMASNLLGGCGQKESRSQGGCLKWIR